MPTASLALTHSNPQQVGGAAKLDLARSQEKPSGLVRVLDFEKSTSLLQTCSHVADCSLTCMKSFGTGTRALTSKQELENYYQTKGCKLYIFCQNWTLWHLNEGILGHVLVIDFLRTPGNQNEQELGALNSLPPSCLIPMLSILFDP